MCLAIPGKIISVEGVEGVDMLRVGKVNFAGVVKQVNLSYVPEAKIGDYVMVHVGFAISVVDEDEAMWVFEYLRSMEELEELKEAAK